MAVGHHWIMQEWLSEVWSAALISLTGRLGFVIAYDLVTLGLFLLIWLRARELGPAHGLTLGVGVLLAGMVAYPILGPRSQMQSSCWRRWYCWWWTGSCDAAARSPSGCPRCS